MTKEEFDNLYVGEDILIWCATKELNNKFWKLAKSFGHQEFEKIEKETLTKTGRKSRKKKLVDLWDIYKENTCYDLLNRQYADKTWEDVAYCKFIEFKG